MSNILTFNVVLDDILAQLDLDRNTWQAFMPNCYIKLLERVVKISSLLFLKPPVFWSSVGRKMCFYTLEIDLYHYVIPFLIPDVPLLSLLCWQCWCLFALSWRALYPFILNPLSQYVIFWSYTTLLLPLLLLLLLCNRISHIPGWPHSDCEAEGDLGPVVFLLDGIADVYYHT